MFKVAWHKCYAHELPAGHRFPMEKYELVPLQLKHEGTLDVANFFEPGILSEEQLVRTHCTQYWNKLKTQSLSKKEERKTGFPLTPGLVTRERRIMQGTIECALHAINDGVSLNIAGGTHHSYFDHGEGFCLLNDQVIASQFLLDNSMANKILIVDLDVHQGNGTAKLCEEIDEIFTFSVHGEKNYPMHKEKSDLDIGLADGTEDAEYLEILTQKLPVLFEKVKPDFVFYQCGVDVLDSDKLGRLSLTIEGCKERDRKVFLECHKRNIPLVCSMGGGYSKDIKVIVEAHANTFRLAKEIYF